MGLINDRVKEMSGDEPAIETTTKELPELLTKLDIVNGFFHLVNGKTSHLYLITKDSEAIAIPITDDFPIGLVSSDDLKEALKEFAMDIDNRLETDTAELLKGKDKYLNILESMPQEGDE